MASADRNSILVESGEVISNQAFDGEQHIIRIHAPRVAARAKPGQFIHIRCSDKTAMRRPMSLMRVDSQLGWLDFLFKIHGQGTAELGRLRAGDPLNLMGPIGKPFRMRGYKPYAVLIGGGVGIPPMIYLAEHMRKHNVYTIVFMGSEIAFPFTAKPSQIMLDGLPNDTIAAMPLLEDWGIPSRLASRQAFAGCYSGLVTELAEKWIVGQSEIARDEIEIFACGPTPMLKAVAALGNALNIANQISLEEYMACAVGGCAGCTVLTNTPEGKKMQRVCVDGPVFDGSTVVFQS